MEHVSIHSRKKVSTSLVLIVGLLSCGGCFLAEGYTKLSKAGTTMQQRHKDLYECKLASTAGSITGMASGGGGFITGGSSPDPSLWRQCLRARGYELEWRSWSDHVDEGKKLNAEREAHINDANLRKDIRAWNKWVEPFNQRMDEFNQWVSDN